MRSRTFFDSIFSFLIPVALLAFATARRLMTVAVSFLLATLFGAEAID